MSDEPVPLTIEDPAPDPRPMAPTPAERLRRIPRELCVQWVENWDGIRIYATSPIGEHAFDAANEIDRLNTLVAQQAEKIKALESGNV